MEADTEDGPRTSAAPGVKRMGLHIVIIGNRASSLVNFRGHLVRRIVSLGHRVTALVPPTSAETVHAIRQLGSSYVATGIDSTGVNPFRDLRSLLSWANSLRRLKPDIVLCYTIKPVIYGSLAARLARVNRVYSMITGLGYAFGDSTFRQKALGFLVRQLYRWALSTNTTVFFQNRDDMSMFTRERLVSHRTTPILINGSGVDLEYFAPAVAVLRGPVFSYMGRMLKAKGIREFVEAATLVKNQFPGTRFRLLGPFHRNPDAIDPSFLANALRNGVVEYHGYVRDVRPFLSESSVFVLPSYREGTPRSVLEAMAMAKPIITTDVPGCRDTVTDGVNGYLVPPQDPEALASAMVRFIHDPSLIDSMGQRSRQLVEKKYDVHEVNHTITKAMCLER